MRSTAKKNGGKGSVAAGVVAPTGNGNGARPGESVGAEAVTVDAMRARIERHLVSTLARHAGSATARDWWVATVLALRDTIHERLIRTQGVHNARNVRRVYYMSLEYLMGRMFGNNLLATGLLDTARDALADRKSTRLNSSHVSESRMPSSA